MTGAIEINERKQSATAARRACVEWIDLPYVFIAGGLVGTIYELLLTLATTGVLEDRSGSVLTPFNYVYGIGALVMFVLLYRLRNPLAIFAIGSVLGGAVEFGLSFIQELVLGSTSWDYSGKLLNIGGRTTVPFMFVWGALCLIGVKLVFPGLLRLIHAIPEPARRYGAMAIACFVALDAALSLTVVLRYARRGAGMLAQNRFSGLIDQVFNDRYMLAHFPNMQLR